MLKLDKPRIQLNNLITYIQNLDPTTDLEELEMLKSIYDTNSPIEFYEKVTKKLNPISIETIVQNLPSYKTGQLTIKQIVELMAGLVKNSRSNKIPRVYQKMIMRLIKNDIITKDGEILIDLN